jgi:hypothetical protein
MSSTRRAARTALVIVAGALSSVAAPTVAGAQRSRPTPAYGPAPEPPRPTTPYPGASVTIDPRWRGRQPVPRDVPGPLRRRQQSHQQQHQRGGRTIVYVPVPGYYPYYPSAGYGYGVGGGVYDTNGRPLGTSAFDEQMPSDYATPHGTPDLSGSPYVVIGGGVMVVDFGNGDVRQVPSCAAEAAERTPDGQGRTLFYQPSYGLVLRAGQRGRVIGTPPAGARMCYTTDQYGRTVLDY